MYDEEKTEALALVGQILPHMPPWYVDHGHDFYNVKVIHPDMPEAALWFGYERKRLTLSGGYPDGHLPYGETPHISVSAERSPESIAKDIHRRFLPQYLALFAQCLKEKAECEANIAHTNAVLDELGSLVGRKPRYVDKSRDGSLDLPFGVTLETYASEAPSFRLKGYGGIPLSAMREICRVLGEMA